MTGNAGIRRSKSPKKTAEVQWFFCGITDAIRLARETSWQEQGETGIIGLGQKTWMTHSRDHALLDLREITFSA